MTNLSKAIVSFIGVLVVVQVIITYIPGLTMWLPNALKRCCQHILGGHGFYRARSSAGMVALI